MTFDAAEIVALESVAARGWPAAREAPLGAWRVYASSGYSGRINACWPLGDPGLPLDAAIDAVEDWYADRGLPPLFKASETVAPAGLIGALAARGYRPRTETLVMAGPVCDARDSAVRLTATLDDGFAAVFAAAGPADPGDARERLETLARVPPPRVFATISVDGRPAAIGATAVGGGWTGVFAMRTAPAFRRQGLARRVLAALIGYGAQNGARRAYLQVEAENLGAIALYAAAGFGEAYRYAYWRKVAAAA